jgi:hypothetical protein
MMFESRRSSFLSCDHGMDVGCSLLMESGLSYPRAGRTKPKSALREYARISSRYLLSCITASLHVGDPTYTGGSLANVRS